MVTGDSESMIAEACATRKPVTIYPLPERPKSAWLRLGDAVVARGLAPRANGLSRVRPDRALEYFCARLLERSFVRPNREMSLFHERLVERGVAGLFRDGIERVVTGSLDDTPRVAQCVRELMGVRD